MVIEESEAVVAGGRGCFLSVGFIIIIIFYLFIYFFYFFIYFFYLFIFIFLFAPASTKPAG